MGRALRRHAALAWWGALTAAILAAVAAAPLLARHDPNRMNIAHALRPPSALYWLGTDEAGRDVLSRVLHGGRESITAAVAVIAAALLVGLVVGAVAGWARGLVDEGLMRLTDLFFAFPPLVLAMAITAALGPSLRNAVVAAIVVWWPTYARLVRGEVLRVRENLYVEAARALGLSDTRLVLRHVLPQSWGVLNARATVDVGYTILFIATLGFVGLGSRPPAAEWGAMIASARTYFLDSWWTMTFPGLALFVTVIAVSLFGDAVNDRVGLRGRRREAGG
jgi:peptide/nickel transport system permease protein